MTVLEFQARPLRSLSDETNLDLAGVARVGLELPLRADVPAEDDSTRWLIGEDASPAAFAPVGGAVVDMAADPRLESGLGDLCTEQIVLGRFEVPEALDECGEGTLDRRVDDDLATDDCITGQVHAFS